jgi:hypothetical protein
MEDVSIMFILLICDLFYGHLIYFMFIWYILCLFGIFFPLLVYCTKKNLATLLGQRPNFLVLHKAQLCTAFFATAKLSCT